MKEEQGKDMTDEQLGDLSQEVELPQHADYGNISKSEQRYQNMCIRYGMLLDRYRKTKASWETRGEQINKLQEKVAIYKQYIAETLPTQDAE